MSTFGAQVKGNPLVMPSGCRASQVSNDVREQGGEQRNNTRTGLGFSASLSYWSLIPSLLGTLKSFHARVLVSWSFALFFFFFSLFLSPLPCVLLSCRLSPWPVHLCRASRFALYINAAPNKVAVHASVAKWLAVTGDSSSHFLCVCVSRCHWRGLCVWGHLAFLSLFLAASGNNSTILTKKNKERKSKRNWNVRTSTVT